MLDIALEAMKLVTDWCVVLATIALFVVTKYDLPAERARALARKPIIGRFMRVTVTETVTETVRES